MRTILVLFIIASTSCNSVKTTQTATSQSNDSSGVNSTTRFIHTSIDNLSVKKNEGTWSRITTYPPIGLVNVQGITVTETGTYNRDQIDVHHENVYDVYKVYNHFNVYHHFNVTNTVTEKKRFAWLPFLFLAIGGVGVFLATRIPLIINLILALINFVISKFKTHKNQ